MGAIAPAHFWTVHVRQERTANRIGSAFISPKRPALIQPRGNSCHSPRMTRSNSRQLQARLRPQSASSPLRGSRRSSLPVPKMLLPVISNTSPCYLQQVSLFRNNRENYLYSVSNKGYYFQQIGRKWSENKIPPCYCAITGRNGRRLAPGFPRTASRGLISRYSFLRSLWRRGEPSTHLQQLHLVTAGILNHCVIAMLTLGGWFHNTPKPPRHLTGSLQVANRKAYARRGRCLLFRRGINLENCSP